MTTLADLVVAQAGERPGARAFTGGGRTHTYASLNLAANRVANGLDAAGVGPGDRVAYWAKNSVEFFEVLFGAAKLNAPPVALNWRLAPREVAYILNDSEAKVVVVGDSFTGMLAEIRDDLRPDLQVLVLGDGYDGWRDVQHTAEIRHPSAPTDVALQLYTSGTTGTPKGVMLPTGTGPSPSRPTRAATTSTKPPCSSCRCRCSTSAGCCSRCSARSPAPPPSSCPRPTRRRCSR